jgi:hypothetical protein
MDTSSDERKRAARRRVHEQFEAERMKQPEKGDADQKHGAVQTVTPAPKNADPDTEEPE